METLIWNGATRAETITTEWAQIKHRLADAARRYDWPAVFEILDEHSELVNSTRPGGTSGYAPLHQAAYAGAKVEVVAELLRRGAWRTLQDAQGQRPIDIAQAHSFRHLESLLAPVFLTDVPAGTLARIQARFHEVIRGRAGWLVRQHALRLPELEVMLEGPPQKFWFAVPGMYGGFSYWLEGSGPDIRLITESWCRVEAGSGQRHEISPSKVVLLEEGFV